MNNFVEILDKSSLKLKLLPLFHSCDIYSLRGILMEKKLTPCTCDVFTDEDLIYCFYGKSSYRIGLNKSTNNLAHFPSCFILKTEKMPNPHKVFPFDTGAFVKLPEIKEDYFHKKMDVKDFTIGNDIDCARALVEKFYSTNENYFNCYPTIEEKDIPPINLEARSYLQLIKEKKQAKFDDRLSSIEVIFNQEIPINKDTVETVILPSTFLDDNRINNIITNELEVKAPITYDTHRGNPIEFQGLIVAEIKLMLKNRSLL